MRNPVFYWSKKHSVDFHDFTVITHKTSYTMKYSDIEPDTHYVVGWNNISLSIHEIIIYKTTLHYTQGVDDKAEDSIKNSKNQKKPRIDYGNVVLRFRIEINVEDVRKYLSKDMKIIALDWQDFANIYFIVHFPYGRDYIVSIPTDLFSAVQYKTAKEIKSAGLRRIAFQDQYIF